MSLHPGMPIHVRQVQVGPEVVQHKVLQDCHLSTHMKGCLYRAPLVMLKTNPVEF